MARAAKSERNTTKKIEPEIQIQQRQARDTKQTTHLDPKCRQKNLTASENWRRKNQPKNQIAQTRTTPRFTLNMKGNKTDFFIEE
jgi:hypothetical protein